MAFNQATADEICRRLAEGESLNAICKTEGLPAESTVRAWALDDIEGFAANYARARSIGYEKLAEELLEIADTPQTGVIRTVKPDGTEEVKHADMIEHRRLRVDSRKWMLSKMLPKVYGDKLDMSVAGSMSVSLRGDDAD